jgi:PAS domain S-box-containing protein
VNESACRILELSREELEEISLTDLDPPEMKDKAPDMMGEFMRTKSLRFQTRYLTRGKKEKILEISVSLFTLKGRPTMLSVIRDITDQMAAQAAIRTLISGLVGTTGRDSLDRITESIAAWLGADCVIIGELSPDREVVKALSTILDGTRISDFSYRLKGTPCERTAQEGFCVFSDGVVSLFPESKEAASLQIRGYAGRSLLDSEGRVVGILCILSRNPLILPSSAKEIIDIIAAKAAAEIGRLKALKALSESEEMLSLVMNGVPTLLAYLDPDLKFVYLNQSYTDWYGCTQADMIGKNLLDILPGDLAASVASCSRQVMDGEEATFESPLHDKSGNYHVLSFRLVPHAREGTVIGIFASMNDITDRKRAEAALQQANKKLSLLSRISRHDIGNQLMILGTLFDLVHMKGTDPGSALYLSHIGEVIENIMQMIRFTGEYEQIGIHSPIWQGISSLVEKAGGTSTLRSSLSDVNLINEIPGGAEIFTDPLVIKVFYNLIENAVRHGGTISTIRFSLETRDNDLVIICTDDGTGISDDEKELIFQRDFGKNTGLGLYLSREILDITGITIIENGEQGKGARFEITVPEGNYRGYSQAL